MSANKITWDDPEVLQNAKRVSPWQVEHISPSALLHTAFPSAKKFKATKYGGLPIDREEDLSLTMMRFTNSTTGHLNHSLLKDNTFPAGMQGARHDLFFISRFSNFLNDNTHLCAASSYVNNSVPKLKTVSTDLLIGCSQYGQLSPDSHSRVHSIGEIVGTHCCNSTKLGAGSFKLFGKIIEMNQPVESGLHGADCTGNKVCNASECTDKPLDYSTYSKLDNRLDVQCQKASLV